MKKCPYCAEDIQDDAVKCRYCGEFLLPEKKPQVKWYFKTFSLVIIFFCVGPLMLPLIWIHPTFSQKKRIIISVIIIAITCWIGTLFVNAVKTIDQYYQLIFQQF